MPMRLMLNKPLTILFIFFVLLPLQFAVAAPNNGAVPNSTLKLAMLDLDRAKDRTARTKNNKVKKSSNKRSKRLKRLVSKRRSIIAKRSSSKRSSGCLSWSTTKINSKAKRFEDAINKYSRQYGIDKNLVKSIITAESCFRVKAKSHADAHGLMQLIPATAKRFGVSNSYDPTQNIRGGIKYLKFLKGHFKGDLKKIIAAYNAGEGAVDKYKGIPPYKETRNYVKNVLKVYARLSPRKYKANKSRVKAVYQPPKMGNKAGRQGWQYNRRLAPHLYKQ